MERLSTAFQNYHVEVLQEMAKRLDLQIDETSVRKSRLVGELARRIPQIARSRTYIRGLSAAERAALAVVLAKDAGAGAQRGATRGATLHDLTLPLMLSGLVQTHQPPRDSAAALPTIQEVVTRLLYQGLLISLSGNSDPSSLRTFNYVGALGIAPEVRAALPEDLLPPPATAPEAVRWEDVAALQVAENDVRQYMRMLFFTWSELRRRPARLLKAGGMGKRDRRRIAEALGLDAEKDLDVVSRFYDMLDALQLVTKGDDTIAAVEGDAVTLYWGARLAGQLPPLVRAYTLLTTEYPAGPALSQLSGYLEDISLQPSQMIRERALDMLTYIAPLGWIPTEMFYNLLCGGRPGSFAFGEMWLGYIYRSMHWYGDSYRRQLEEALSDTERQLIRRVLDELYTLGFVGYGYTASQGQNPSELPAAIRASEALRDYAARVSGGANAANYVPPRREEASWQVILQPDFQMLAMGPVPLRVLANLENFVVREKIDESVITYRITRDEVYEAFQRGETVTTILGYLTEATDQPVPQNVIRSLEEWHEQFERIVIRRQVCVFQADSADLMAQLLEDPTLSQYLHRLGADLAWLRPDDSDRVAARLEELEILPARSPGPEDDLQDSLRWHDEELEPKSPTPSIYVTGYLKRIAEPHAGRWRLTPESIGQAVTLGIDVETIQSRLVEMTGSKLPSVWDKRLKAWGNYFGDASVGDVQLLRLDHRDALAALREADRELRRWLQPVPGAPQMAIVDDGHWEEVHARLASWGIKVTAERWW